MTIASWEMRTDTINSTSSWNMIHISGGTFIMGDEKEGNTWEKPEHEVHIDPFYLGQYPVSQALWESLMETNPSYFPGPRRPVEQVSWKDIQKFLQRLNHQLDLSAKQRYRLPTEAEWEYAARAGNRTRYAGSEGLDCVSWYRENSQNQSHEIGLKAPNEWGLYGMTGNIWEWCQDWYKGRDLL